jgi:ribonucleoside-diphosphate reductase alpha chain
MSFINDKSHEESERLGGERGNFTAFKGSIWEKAGIKNMRNARTTTIAPTGTISIVAGCHPGIEPIFALVYRIQNSMGGTDQIMIDRLFEEVAKVRGFYSDELMEKVADGTKLTLIDEIPDDVAEVFVTAHHVVPEQHVKIQAAFQKHVDSGVSKTINLPEETTPKQIEHVYKLAYELGCKGITVFRDGAKAGAQVVGKKRKGHKKVSKKK